MIKRSNSSLKNKSKLSSRKGVSLVEVVVALTIISIISVAAFSLIMSSMDLENNIMRDVEISASADDVLDCFIFAKTEAEFAKSIAVLGYVKYPNLYLLEKGSCEITVTYAEDRENGIMKMTFEAWDSNGTILKREHTKGDDYEFYKKDT